MLKRLWKDHIVGALIVAAVIGIFTTFGGLTYLLRALELIKYSILFLFQFFVQPVVIPAWLFAILSGIAISSAARALNKRIVPRKANWFEDYRADEIRGVLWKWAYSHSGKVINKRSYCPKCGFQIHPYDSSFYISVNATTFSCDDCHNFSVNYHNEDLISVESFVERKIYQRINASEWQQADSRISEARH